MKGFYRRYPKTMPVFVLVGSRAQAGKEVLKKAGFHEVRAANLGTTIFEFMEKVRLAVGRYNHVVIADCVNPHMLLLIKRACFCTIVGMGEVTWGQQMMHYLDDNVQEFRSISLRPQLQVEQDVLPFLWAGIRC